MASCTVDFSSGRCVVFITGASRGIGREIAVQAAAVVGDGSIFVLIARSKSGLGETRRLILEVNDKISIMVCVLDLSLATEKAYEDIFLEAGNKLDGNNFDLAVLFHNAGQAGLLTNSTNITELQTWRNYFEMNYFSAAVMTSFYVKIMKSRVSKMAVVNMTSLIGRKPIKNMAMYGSVKAAKEMYFKVLALEEKDLIVLNYSPGPVETDMFNDIITGASDDELKCNFKKMKEDKFVLSAAQTVSLLMGLLKKGDFESGDTVDYYDRMPLPKTP